MLVLSLPKRYVRQQAPSTRTLIYLDDRSIVSLSCQDMQQAQQAWAEVETASRMRTHPGKTPALGRSWAAGLPCSGLCRGLRSLDWAGLQGSQ